MKNKPKVIAITETKPKNCKGSLFPSEFNLEGYQCFCLGLDDLTSRGVLLYVDSDLNASLVDIPTAFKECIFVLIKCSNNTKLLIGNMYRSPSSSDANDDNLFKLIKHITSQYNIPTLLVGDFNFPEIQWNSEITCFTGLTQSEVSFAKTIGEHFLDQHVDKPTRQRGKDTPHMLDLVISSEEFVSDIVHASPIGLSDHAVLTFTCNLEGESQMKPESYKWDKGNYVELRSYLNRDWELELDSESSSVDEMWCHFRDILLDGMKNFIPRTKNKNFRDSRKTFFPFNKALQTLIRKKHRLWNRWIDTRKEDKHKEYIKMRNRVKSETRKLIKLEQDNIAVDCKNNPKKFWKYIKSKSKTKTTLGDLKWKDEKGNLNTAETDSDKATALEEYFSSVFTVEGDQDFEKLAAADIKQPMQEFKISLESVKTKLGRLKTDKSPGVDHLHPRVLCEAREQLALPLTMIFNKSLATGLVPEDWKMAEVVALHKKGSRSDRANYRPISLTSISCKILESLIRDHIMEYLLTNGLLSNRQYGFAKGRSTMLQLLHMLDRWTEYLENGGQVDAIYTDFEKAFDKVPHRRLISKLRSYGISNKIIDWIQDFLHNRQHRVKINGSFSKWGKVTSGIPQGSVLGPLLFLIYINDLPDFCEEDSELYLFADDAKLTRYIRDISDNIKLQSSIDNLQDWSNKWLLKLNKKKCKIISFGRNISDGYVYDLTENNSKYQLERVSQITDLGVILDSRLTFSQHIQTKINKAYSMIGLLRRNFDRMSISSFTVLYKSMVRSHLDYCNSVWAPYLKSDTEDLEKIQKRATKILPALRNLSYPDRLKRCGLPTLKFRRIRGDMIETFKILTGKYDSKVAPNFALVGSTSTRGNDYKLQNARTHYDLRKHFFTNRVTNIWNSLPNDIVKVDSTNQFKNRLDKFWQNQEIFYNYKAELTGIGSRSEVVNRV